MTFWNSGSVASNSFGPFLGVSRCTRARLSCAPVHLHRLLPKMPWFTVCRGQVNRLAHCFLEVKRLCQEDGWRAGAEGDMVDAAPFAAGYYAWVSNRCALKCKGGVASCVVDRWLRPESRRTGKGDPGFFQGQGQIWSLQRREWCSFMIEALLGHFGNDPQDRTR